MKMFLDPTQPITTCAQSSCEDCPVSGSLHCHFYGRDLAKFFTAAAPVFIFGAVGIYRFGAWALLIWLGLILSYFGLIEIRVMCSHCPHYAEPGGSLKCWANYGSPKLWHYRPGPMSAMEKLVFLAGLIVIFGYPLPFILLKTGWLLAGLYGLSLLGGYMFMRSAMCSHCMNFACPLNWVDPARREVFFKRNPAVAEAWGAFMLTPEQNQGIDHDH
jgi:hypothetical protein